MSETVLSRLVSYAADIRSVLGFVDDGAPTVVLESVAEELESICNRQGVICYG